MSTFGEFGTRAKNCCVPEDHSTLHNGNVTMVVAVQTYLGSSCFQIGSWTGSLVLMGADKEMFFNECIRSLQMVLKVSFPLMTFNKTIT